LEKPHRRLIVWQKSVELTTDIYRLTQKFPAGEQYGLVSQMRRAATSIPCNIAEGAARGKKEYLQFLRVAIGSVSELDTQLEIAQRLGYLSAEDYRAIDDKLAEVNRMLLALRQSIAR
jgi:four helix bundle protein